MRDVLAPLYSNLLVRVSALVIADVTRTNSKRQSQDVNAIMSRQYPQVMDLLPCPVPPEPWNDLSSALFQSLREVKLLWSQRRGGQLVSPSSALLIVSSSGTVADSTSPSNTPNENEEEVSVNNRLQSILLQEDLAVVRVSRDVLKALIEERSPRKLRHLRLFLTLAMTNDLTASQRLMQKMQLALLSCLMLFSCCNTASAI